MEWEESTECLKQFRIMVKSMISSKDVGEDLNLILQFFVRSDPKEKVTMFNYLLGEVYNDRRD